MIAPLPAWHTLASFGLLCAPLELASVAGRTDCLSLWPTEGRRVGPIGGGASAHTRHQQPGSNPKLCDLDATRAQKRAPPTWLKQAPASTVQHSVGRVLARSACAAQISLCKTRLRSWGLNSPMAQTEPTPCRGKRPETTALAQSDSSRLVVLRSPRIKHK